MPRHHLSTAPENPCEYPSDIASVMDINHASTNVNCQQFFHGSRDLAPMHSVHSIKSRREPNHMDRYRQKPNKTKDPKDCKESKLSNHIERNRLLVVQISEEMQRKKVIKQRMKEEEEMRKKIQKMRKNQAILTRAEKRKKKGDYHHNKRHQHCIEGKTESTDPLSATHPMPPSMMQLNDHNVNSINSKSNCNQFKLGNSDHENDKNRNSRNPSKSIDESNRLKSRSSTNLNHNKHHDRHHQMRSGSTSRSDSFPYRVYGHTVSLQTDDIRSGRSEDMAFRGRTREHLKQVQHEQEIENVKRQYERKMELMEMEHRRIIQQFQIMAMKNMEYRRTSTYFANLNQQHDINSVMLSSKTFENVQDMKQLNDFSEGRLGEALQAAVSNLVVEELGKFQTEHEQELQSLRDQITGLNSKLKTAEALNTKREEKRRKRAKKVKSKSETILGERSKCSEREVIDIMFKPQDHREMVKIYKMFNRRMQKMHIHEGMSLRESFESYLDDEVYSYEEKRFNHMNRTMSA